MMVYGAGDGYVVARKSHSDEETDRIGKIFHVFGDSNINMCRIRHRFGKWGKSIFDVFFGWPCFIRIWPARPGSGEPAKFFEDSETFSSSRRLLAGRPFMDLLPESSKIARPPPDLLDFHENLLKFLDFS